MLKSKMIYFISGFLILGFALTIQSNNSDFKASLLSSKEVGQQLAEINDFYHKNDSYGFSLKKEELDDAVLTCVCRLKTSNKICGILYFYPHIKDKEQRESDNLVILTPNLNHLCIDKKYTSWPSQIETQSQIVSVMLQDIELVCKQKRIKKLFVLVSPNNFGAQKVWSACGFYSPWFERGIPGMSQPPLIWFEKKL